MFITKMHGLGNDFIVVEDSASEVSDYNAFAKDICRQHLSVGADGIMVVLPSKKADVRMRIVNSDGSEAEMCGNGIRCFARYVYDKGIVNKLKMEVETLAGIIRPEIILKDGAAASVKVNMGRPEFERSLIPMQGMGSALKETIEIDGVKLDFSTLLMGVPHTVVFTEGIDTIDTASIGPRLEKHALFPRKTNVNFIEVLDRHTIRNKTWERGAGFTLACGTGSCASVVAASIRGLVESKAVVKVPAGELLIEYAADGTVYMTGAAEYVFEGRLL
jgi:diaminopimelate epimerase